MIFFARAHHFVGIVFFALFLLTGAYMLLNFPGLYSGREEIRMMYRATHIYILMSSLVNLMAGNYLLNSTQSKFLILKKYSSSLIMLAPVLFLVAFIYEPADYLIERPVSFWGVVVLVGGVIVHSLLNMKWFNKNAN